VSSIELKQQVLTESIDFQLLEEILRTTTRNGDGASAVQVVEDLMSSGYDVPKSVD